MVLVEVKMLSGFSAEKETVTALAKISLVKRTEISDYGTVTIYLDEVPRQAQEYSFTIKQDIPVTNQQPATVEAYDYYQNEERTLVEYVIHSSTGKTPYGGPPTSQAIPTMVLCLCSTRKSIPKI